MTSMLHNSLLKAGSYTDGRGILLFRILNIRCHIHKTLSLGLKSNLVKIHFNIIIPPKFKIVN